MYSATFYFLQIFSVSNKLDLRVCSYVITSSIRL